MDTAELLILLSKNKEEGFRYILKSNKERVYWHVRKMVFEHEDANDLTQDTFLKVWNNLDKFKGESQVYTWIHRIATNICLTFLEKKKKTQTVDLEVEPIIQGPDTVMTSEVVVTRLLAALKVIPPKQRLVFNLKYFDNMKYEEIADLTDSSVGSLKASYHFAVKKIEEFLQRD